MEKATPVKYSEINLKVERPKLDKSKVYEKDQLLSHYMKKYKETDKKKVTSLMELGSIKACQKNKRKDGEDDDEDQTNDETIVLASYSRCGNTLLRTYLEKIMGLITGSDCDMDRPLNLDLFNKGLCGEGLVDKRFWVVKTHYPERWTRTTYYAEKCILCIRNPLYTLESLFNFIATDSHEQSMAPEEYKRFAILWNEFIMQEILVWRDFYTFWLKSNIPIHIIRFEDIIS
jgi:hypothetical protein